MLDPIIQALVDRRHALGWTRGRVGNILSGDRKGEQIGRWEKGLHSPSLFTAGCWAQALKLKLKVEIDMEAVQPAVVPCVWCNELDKYVPAYSYLGEEILRNAKQRSDAQVEEGKASLGIKERAEGQEPTAGNCDHAE